jgi:hypothetical protein
MLTQKFLVNHCSQGLYEQVLMEYDDDAIEDEERVGPLFFILMINELLATTEDAAKVLEERIRKFDLQTIENVKKAKQLLLSGIHFLEQVSRLPSDIVLILIKVFQTSSVDEFNNMFAHLENGCDIDQMLMQGNRHLVPSSTYSYRDIILLAVNKHQLLCTKGTWNGVLMTGTDSAFVQNQSWTRTTPVCWTCGGQHTLVECGKERNSARIEEGKQLLMAAREERRVRSAENEGGPAENNGGGEDWKTQPPLPGSFEKNGARRATLFFSSAREKMGTR